MHELERLNTALKAEADRILNDYGLLKILKQYGQPTVTGSYALGLMNRRDLDINLATDAMTENKFSRLRNEITTALKMRRIQYLNEFKERHPRLPLGFYIGGITSVFGESKEWELDIWSMDTRQAQSNQQSIAKLLSFLSTEQRQCILEIKHACLEQPGYQHRYFSVDIYKAVLESGITGAADFIKWADKSLTDDRTI